MFLIPQNRICPGMSPKFPITDYNPFLWIKIEHDDIGMFKIDGFIIDTNRAIKGIFQKIEYEYSGKEIDTVTMDDIQTIISYDELLCAVKFSQVFNCMHRIFIWPKDFPDKFDINAPMIFSIEPKLNNDELSIEIKRKITLEHLQKAICYLRGRSFVNVKPLTTASSNVECYLAKNTNDPWPGDIDAVLYDKKKDRFHAMIEFKTHNIDSPIENEHVGRYGKKDWRRFDVLFDLQDNFYGQTKYKPKLFFIVWGTGMYRNHRFIKIDEIERDKIVNTWYINRPEFNRFSRPLFEFLIDKAAYAP